MRGHTSLTSCCRSGYVNMLKRAAELEDAVSSGPGGGPPAAGDCSGAGVD